MSDESATVSAGGFLLHLRATAERDGGGWVATIVGFAEGTDTGRVEADDILALQERLSSRGETAQRALDDLAAIASSRVAAINRRLPSS